MSNSLKIISYKGPYEFSQICNNFNKMVSKLNESEKQKMLADISHDFKTPITNIQGYSKALYDGVICKEDQEKYLKIIYQKSNNLTELINVFYEYIYDIGFEIDIDIPDDEMICNFDSIQLKRAFDNIINNSIKHNNEKTIIGICLKEEHDYYKIIICDNGIGIPDDIIENIFDPFVVGDESRNTKQGSGLGLAITKKIIEKHNGTIKLISSEKEIFKTIFEMKLPK